MLCSGAVTATAAATTTSLATSCSLDDEEDEEDEEEDEDELLSVFSTTMGATVAGCSTAFSTTCSAEEDDSTLAGLAAEVLDLREVRVLEGCFLRSDFSVLVVRLELRGFFSESVDFALLDGFRSFLSP